MTNLTTKNELLAVVAEVITAVTGTQALSAQELISYEDAAKLTWYRTLDESFYLDVDYPWMMLNCYSGAVQEGWYRGTSLKGASPRGWYGSRDRISDTCKVLTKIGYQPRRILDLGAGIGLGTAQLAENFPRATVIYQNLASVQTEVARKLTRQLGLSNVEFSLSADVNADVVVATELFEHIREPLVLVDKALRSAQVYSDASSFSIKSAGHWPEYLVGTDLVPARLMKKRFTAHLRELGFETVAKRGLAKPCWNNRPQVWTRRETLSFGR